MGKYVTWNGWMGKKIGALFAERFEEVVDGYCKFLLDFHVTNFPDTITLLEVINFGLRGIEGIVIDEYRIALHRAQIRGAQTFGIGIHVHHLLLNGLCIVREIDRIAKRFAHLPLSVGTDKQGNIADNRVRFGEDFVIKVVETACQLTRKLHMGLVIASNRDNLGARK